ncbi:MAG: hypothetical protein SPL82_14885 [Lachnospiraceae bacterium]|nr:hypothetical protein [Lachnospiraceae bacterium]
MQDNIDDLCEFMMLNSVHIEDFTDIYVLGHSLAEVDYEYFEFLVKATQAGCNFNELSALWKIKQLGLENLDEGRDFLHNIRIRLKGERSLLAAGRTVVIV